MGIQVRSEHVAMSDINVTPLVDVMLVLLIVFMVTAPLMIQAVPMNLPKTATTKPVTEPRNVTLSINKNGEFFIDRKPFMLDAIEPELTARAGKGADVALLVQADGGVNFERVAQALAAAQRAGITRVSVLTAPQ
jgi:biopolymer transport protein ExbD